MTKSRTIDLEKVKGKSLWLKEKYGMILDAQVLASDCGLLLIDHKHKKKTRISFITGELEVLEYDW